MIRVILDTNVLVSAVLGKTLAPVLDHWRAGDFVLVVSSDIVREYIAVLRRPKFHLPPEAVDDLSSYLIRQADFVTPVEKLPGATADPKDDRFIEAAVAGRVDFIVSGDHHLLSLNQFRGIPILTARDFLEKLSFTIDN